MRESEKSVTGDHRVLSDPTPERKDFIKHLKENAPVEEDKEREYERKADKVNEDSKKTKH